MPEPLVNVDEPVGRVVGRRRPPTTLAIGTDARADARAWQRAFGGTRVPRGVHRFQTHEAADEWLWRMMTRRRT